MLSSTITSNVNSTDSPAFTSTFSHIIEFFSALYPLTFVSFILVPSGIASVTVTVPSPFPLFVNVIVYVNVSPTFASVAFTSFLPVIFATFVSTSSVGVFPIVAIFFTDFTTSPAVVFSFTTTSKLTETSPFAGTSTFIPSFKFSAV